MGLGVLKLKVFLNAGHGGIDSGALGNGMQEKNINLEVTLQSGAIVKRHGVDVMFSRTTDIAMELQAICNMANNWGADLFVSVHHNWAGVPTADGAEGYHSVFADKGGALVDNIMAEFKAIGQNIRNVADTKWNSAHNDDWYGILRGLAPSVSGVLIEFGFIDTVDSQIFNTTQKRTVEAEAIAKGILKTLGIVYVPLATTPAQVKQAPVTILAPKFENVAVVVLAPQRQIITLTVKGTWHVRTGAGVNFNTVTQVNNGTKLEVFADVVNGWYELTNHQFISDGAFVMPIPKPARQVIWIVTTGKYNVRQKPSIFGKIDTVVGKGTRLQVFADKINGWYQLTNGIEYISGDCIK